MNIIVGESVAKKIDDRYLILELDSFQVPDNPELIKTYCLIEKITLEDIVSLEQTQDLHKNLIKNYRLKNWKFCLNALEHLTGKWNGELDSFYAILKSRIEELKTSDLDEGWNGSIKKIKSDID